MPFKFDENGQIAVQEVNGQKLPVFVHKDGKESPFDAEATMESIRTRAEQAARIEADIKALRDKVKTFDGIEDPAAALKALATVKNLDDKKLVDAGEVEKVKAEVQKALEQQYEPFKAKAEALEAQLNQHLIGGVFSGSKYISEKFAAQGPAGVEIARALFANRFKVEDGKAIATDGSGNKLYSRVHPGELAVGDEAIELLVDAYPHKGAILRGAGAPGSGAGSSGGSGFGGGGGSKIMKRADFEALDPAGRMAALKASPQIVD